MDREYEEALAEVIADDVTVSLGSPDPQSYTTVRPTAFTREASANREVAEELLALLLSKNAGYGRNLQRHGLKGIVIRLSDKLMRLEHMVLGGVPDYVQETVDETLFDIAGYAVKALALRRLNDLPVDGEWRGES